MTDTLHIEYSASVFTDAGWRGVTICAEAQHISPKMVEVTEVVSIDGEPPTGYTSRTGAKRQRYHAGGVAKRELGKHKRLSACRVIETDAA